MSASCKAANFAELARSRRHAPQAAGNRLQHRRGAALLWVALLFLIHPNPLVAIFLMPFCGGAGGGTFWVILQMKLRKRLDAFVQQLEMALRLIASGVRIGLGLRQALTIVIEEMPIPPNTSTCASSGKRTSA